MFCLQCGASNPGGEARCASCGRRLEAVSAVVEQPFLRRLQGFWDGISPAARAVASLAVGLFGLFVMRSARDLSTSFVVILAGLFIAAVGIFLGWASLQASRPRPHSARVSSIWCKGAACGGMVLSGGVALVPVTVAVGAIAALPKNLVAEPVALSNMRRLSVALQAYAEDYGDRYPGWVLGADGRAYHNVWDQQIFPYSKYNATFNTGADGRGIRSAAQPPPRNRILTVGLNGLLITRPKARFDGNADWSGGPVSASPGSLNDPASTIVLAELATSRPMGGPYATVETPGPKPRGVETREYQRALAQWVDIDPRAWVETSGPEKSYVRGKWDRNRGVGRELHPGGAAFAFADGHVEMRRLRQTLTGGRTGMDPETFWSPQNDANQWNPHR